MAWLEVSVCVEPEAAEAVAEVLSRYAPQGVAIDVPVGDEPQAAPVTVKAYIAVDEEIGRRQREIEAAIGHLQHIWPVIPDPEFRQISDQDWTAAWKESIPILHLGRRVVIKPSWREYEPKPNECVLEMDPGQAFGTGLHPTTQLCVELLEEQLEPGMRVLDLGTGTGILAFLAARMGAADVLAVDNDVSAVTAARRNARANDLVQGVRIIHGSLEDVGGVHDLVLANILAPVIIAMAESGLAARLRVGGKLVASGILVEQAPEVSKALEQHGLCIEEQRTRGDWVALLARKVHALPTPPC